MGCSRWAGLVASVGSTCETGHLRSSLRQDSIAPDFGGTRWKRSESAAFDSLVLFYKLSIQKIKTR